MTINEQYKQEKRQQVNKKTDKGIKNEETNKRQNGGQQV